MFRDVETLSWRRAVQVLIGFFFTAAAYHKLTNSFFGQADVPLTQVFDYWITSGWPLWYYKNFMQWSVHYPRLLGAGVIFFQGAAGLMLIYNQRVRLAAAMLLFVQIHIFLGTFHNRGFNVFVGISLWLCVYYLFQGTIHAARGPPAQDDSATTLLKRQENLLPYPKFVSAFLTFALIVLLLMSAHARYRMGDPWIAGAAWHRAHFAGHVMSASPVVKAWTLSLFSGDLGLKLWASAWWIHLLFTLLLLTRYRIFAGAALLVLWILRVNIWMNSITSEGVLWVLVLFLWVVQEEYWQRYGPPVRLMPRLSDLQRVSTWIFSRKGKSKRAEMVEGTS